MAAKNKVNNTTFDGIDYGLIFAQQQTDVRKAHQLFTQQGHDKDTVDSRLNALFAGLIADKGQDIIKTALDTGKKAAAKAKADARKAANRAVLDEYNADKDNANKIASVGQALDAAKAALAAAKADLSTLQDEVTGKLDVAWSLDVQIVKGDDGAYKVYIPSDSLARKPKSKGSGTRKKRIYDYSAGKWGRTIQTDNFGEINWTVTGNDKDGFDVQLTWTSPDGKAQNRKGKGKNMSSVGKKLYFVMAAQYGNPNGWASANKIPLNLPSDLKVDWTYKTDKTDKTD